VAGANEHKVYQPSSTASGERMRRRHH